LTTNCATRPCDFSQLSRDCHTRSALRALNILDTAPEIASDEIAKLAAQICGCPVGYSSLHTRSVLGGGALSGNFRHASRTRRDCEAESVQFDDRRHQAQAEPQARIGSALIGPVKSARDEFVFVCSNARSRVAHAHYALITLTREAQLDAAPLPA